MNPSPVDEKSNRSIRRLALVLVILVLLGLGGGMIVILGVGESRGLAREVEQPERHGRDRLTLEQMITIPPGVTVIDLEYEVIERVDVPPDEQQYLKNGRRAVVAALRVDPATSPDLDTMITMASNTAGWPGSEDYDMTMPCLRRPCLPRRYFVGGSARIDTQPSLWSISTGWFGGLGQLADGWAVYDGEDETIYLYMVDQQPPWQ